MVNLYARLRFFSKRNRYVMSRLFMEIAINYQHFARLCYSELRGQSYVMSRHVMSRYVVVTVMVVVCVVIVVIVVAVVVVFVVVVTVAMSRYVMSRYVGSRVEN